MPSADLIQYKIDKGRGIAARVLGGPFSVYRLQAGSRNFLDASNLIQSNYLVYHTQKGPTSYHGSYEGTHIGVPLFDVIGNMQPFLVGDVFINTDAAYPTSYGPGATSVAFSTLEIYGFCLGFHGAVKKSIGARIDRLAQFYSLAPGPTSGYFGGATADSLPIKVRNGVVLIGQPTDTAAVIPIGLAARPRWRRDLIESIPTTTGEVEYIAYVPPLPGYNFKEGDRMVLQDGSRYVIQLPWEQEVGFVGSQFSIKREVMQAA